VVVLPALSSLECIGELASQELNEESHYKQSYDLGGQEPAEGYPHVEINNQIKDRSNKGVRAEGKALLD